MGVLGICSLQLPWMEKKRKKMLILVEMGCRTGLCFGMCSCARPRAGRWGQIYGLFSGTHRRGCLLGVKCLVG